MGKVKHVAETYAAEMDENQLDTITILPIPEIKSINEKNVELERHFQNILTEDNKLSRPIVSFQANKKIASFRWYKYKEAFSSSLVDYFINKLHLQGKKILDPFAGIGTTLFSVSSLGCNTIGIELLPIGQKIIEARINAHYGRLKEDLHDIDTVIKTKPWLTFKKKKPLNELRITKNAYPTDTKEIIESYLSFLETKNTFIKQIYELALLSILEEISYTRKDGQYLRWDYRANRSWGAKKFDKGRIEKFDDAITRKLKEIRDDLKGHQNLFLFDNKEDIKKGEIFLINGSCLEELPKFERNSIDAVITSPPYCNRYDYTRTYALELALLGIDEQRLSELRQNMLSCTVENREKDLLKMNPSWLTAINAVEKVELLNSILEYLIEARKKKLLNNNGIIRMIKGYFYEMACVIYELHRILNRNGYVVLVNDNVRYAGVDIPVDLILSKTAENIGFKINRILVLPQKKGNSSQQMGLHGRTELRKCVYIWAKV